LGEGKKEEGVGALLFLAKHGFYRKSDRVTAYNLRASSCLKYINLLEITFS
jgi:hypothetical protein